MGNRVRGNPRCWGCGLTPSTCLCATLPRLRFATPLAIVQHNREEHKPTNTGRLLARMVESATLVRYGFRGETWDPGPLADPSIEWRVLYPRKGGPVLEPARQNHQAALERAPKSPGSFGARGYVLLDGTWTQAARMVRRVPIVNAMPAVGLPPGPPSIWRVREQRDGGLSTFEAGLRVLELSEGAEAVAPLRDAFERITAQLLFLKGRLPSPSVPDAWRAG